MKENTANKNVADGYAGLGADGKRVNASLPTIDFNSLNISATSLNVNATLADRQTYSVEVEDLVLTLPSTGRIIFICNPRGHRYTLVAAAGTFIDEDHSRMRINCSEVLLWINQKWNLTVYPGKQLGTLADALVEDFNSMCRFFRFNWHSKSNPQIFFRTVTINQPVAGFYIFGPIFDPIMKRLVYIPRSNATNVLTYIDRITETHVCFGQ